MNDEVALLKKQIALMQKGLLGCICLLFLFIFLAFTGKEKNQQFGIIRAKGIVIEDSKGRDRILIGAPFPASANRVRTDTTLVRKHWAKNYKNQNQFMKWYKDYNHSAIGMVVMNEEGFDRVQIGDKLSDPNSGKRMFEPAGITWNDREAWERGGAGVNTTQDGKARSIMGVDDDGGEAVHIVALEDGTKGMMIGGENERLMIGMSKKDGQWFQNKEAFTGVKNFDANGKVLWEQQMLEKIQPAGQK